MSWFQAVGILLVSAGIAFLYYLAPLRRHRLLSTESAEPASIDPMGMRLAAHVKGKEDLRRRLYVAMTLAAFAAGVLLLIVPDHGRLDSDKTGGIPPGSTVFPGANPVPKGTASPDQPEAAGERPSQPGLSGAANMIWAVAAMGGLAVIVGGAILVFGPKLWVRLVGAGTLALGLTGPGYLVKEVKFSELFKFDTHIDKLALELKLEAKLKQLSEFGPERLPAVEGFESGKAELRPEMDEPIAKICRRWNEQGGKTQKGLLLITGSADRMPLAASIRRQYESNVGLARARAEQVRARVLNCGVPADQIVTLVSGPRNTPALQRNQTPAGFAEDRSVVVWALWSVPVAAGGSH
jgi:outer membrane protein OmpA-like peptidoglycan-associated protein